ncbi:hypothetical protein HPHPA6_0035 [Helicobacter pylori Hp A-6]|uniref:Uncharacterized protein n=1 Tax=Helicobacter pylori Hp H-34 TaxID=992069 RepID=J0PGY0_HELPX|nr:hypothetical protein HPHPA6_0035 [Helicobacter pylori Hp A-6]EJB97785.1 hypothetical protein HPHPH34_0289 [Helicobacter pylori Hp H-34]
MFFKKWGFSQSLHCFRFFNSNNFSDRGVFCAIPPLKK